VYCFDIETHKQRIQTMARIAISETELAAIRLTYVGKAAFSKATHKASGAVAYLFNSKKNYPCAVVFSGKRSKPDLYRAFQNEKIRADSVEKMFAEYNSRAEYKASQKCRELNVGDILVSSWGYEQTNVDFYQVVKLIGNASVSVRRIKASKDYTMSMQGNAMALKDDFCGAETVYRVNKDSIRINSYSHAYKWDGTPKFFSEYA